MTPNKERLLLVSAAVIAGAAYWWLLTLFWAYWATFNPIARALLVPGDVSPYYRWVLYPTDFLTSVLVTLPFAALLLRFGKRHLWLCVAAATLPALWGFYWPAFVQPHSGVLRVMLVMFAVQLVILPVSVLLARMLARRFAPNNSFKPNPLRGSA